MMDFGGGKGHGQPNVRHLNPCSIKVYGPFEFGDDSDSALLHHLRNELVRVEQLSADRGEQTSAFCLTRIVCDVRNSRAWIAGCLTIGYARDVCDANRVLWFGLSRHRHKVNPGLLFSCASVGAPCLCGGIAPNKRSPQRPRGFAEARSNIDSTLLGSNLQIEIKDSRL